MADPTCPCYVCGTTCKDWGPSFHSVCATCENEIYSRIGWTALIPANGNGFNSNCVNQYPVMMAMKNEREGKTCSSSDLTITAQRSEKPCKQCGRNNDVGVGKCWHCECLQPTA